MSCDAAVHFGSKPASQPAQARLRKLHSRSEDRRAKVVAKERCKCSQLLLLIPSLPTYCRVLNQQLIPITSVNRTSLSLHIVTMFPRRFAQSMQAAAKQSSAATARVQRSAFVSQQFTPAVSQRLSGMRMYSDAPAAEAKKTEEAGAEKDAKVEEDPVKAELETKKKELLEATVRLDFEPIKR